MNPFKSKSKLMWYFLSEKLKSGTHGNRFYAVKRYENGYIIAVKVMNQKKLSNARLNKRDEWALLLEYCQLKGRAAPKTTKEFTNARSSFFSAVPKCRCIPDGKFCKISNKKDFETLQFEPLPDYKYFLFTCSKAKFMPDWPLNYFENGPSSPQVVPRSGDVLEMAMDEAELYVDNPQELKWADLKSEPLIEDNDDKFEDIENMPVQFYNQLTCKGETPVDHLGYCSNNPPRTLLGPLSNQTSNTAPDEKIALYITNICEDERRFLFQNLTHQLATMALLSPEVEILNSIGQSNGASPDVNGAPLEIKGHFHGHDGALAVLQDDGAIPPVALRAVQDTPGGYGVTLHQPQQIEKVDHYLHDSIIKQSSGTETLNTPEIQSKEFNFRVTSLMLDGAIPPVALRAVQDTPSGYGVTLHQPQPIEQVDHYLDDSIIKQSSGTETLNTPEIQSNEFNFRVTSLMSDCAIPPVALRAVQDTPGVYGVTLHQPQPIEQVDHYPDDSTIKQSSGTETLNTPDLSPSMNWDPNEFLNTTDESHLSPRVTEESFDADLIIKLNEKYYQFDFESLSN